MKRLQTIVLVTSFAVMYTIVYILCSGCTATGLTYKTVKPTTEEISLVGKVDLKTGDVELQGKSKLAVVEVGDNPSPTGKDGSMIIGLWRLFFGLIVATILVSWLASFWVKFIPKKLLAIAVNVLAMGVAWLLLGYHYLDVLVTGLLALTSAAYLYDLIGKKVLNKVKTTGLGVLYRLIHK